MKVKRLLPLVFVVLGVSAGVGKTARAQALPPGQEEEVEATVKKRPPFAGLGLEVLAWDATGLWGGGGAYRNSLDLLFIPSWNIGKRYIGRGPFKTLSLSLRFTADFCLAGFDESCFQGDAPPVEQQKPCATGPDAPRCDFASGPRRVDYSDLTLILANPHIYTIPRALIHIDPSLLLTLPVSAQSRLQTLVMQVIAQVGVSRDFWKDRLGLGYSFGFGKPFYQHNIGQVGGSGSGASNLPYSNQQVSSGFANFYNDPERAPLLLGINPFLLVRHSFRASLNIKNFGATVLYIITNTEYHNFCSDGDQACQNSKRLAGLSDYPWKDNQLLWLSFNYQVLKWLGINLSYITAAPLWQYDYGDPSDPSSTAVGNGQSTRHYRQGIWSADANAFTTISLGVGVSVDALAAKFMRKE